MLNDDLISAYLDDELDAERRAMVEQYLRTDRGAAARLERMRGADSVLRQAFPAVDETRDNLLGVMILAPNAQPAPRRWATQIAALAAAALVGVLIGQVVRSDGNETRYAISAQQTALLNALPSGESARADGEKFEAILSLASDDGAVCRQFRMTGEEARTDVLACRQGDTGSWRMVAAAPAPAQNAYIPAGANSPIDAAIEGLGSAQALDTEREREMIAQGWR